MSFRNTYKLLQLAHQKFEIKKGPFDKGRHALTIEDDKLILSINDGTQFNYFVLNEEGLDRDPSEIIEEISEYFKSRTN